MMVQKYPPMSNKEVKPEGDDEKKEEESREHLKSASDSFIEGGAGFASGIEELLNWYRGQLKNGYLIPTLTTLALGPILKIAGDGISQVAELTWGSGIYVSRDIIIENFPVPLSLTLYFLISIIIVNYLVTYLKISELQMQMAELKDEID